MATQYERIEDEHRAFIEAQHLFFTATAAPEGRVNVSPKGMDTLRVLGPDRIIWLNYTGSGNETAAHLLQSGRMTLMWCGFGKRPLILRAYGTARTIHPRDPQWATLIGHFDTDFAARQIFDLRVEMVQTSCGYGVPFYEYEGEREVLPKWAEARGPEYVNEYWIERNARSIDGYPTGIEE